jgi:hypothetical protein
MAKWRWSDMTMRFAFPRFPAEFELPDDWWLEAGMQGFVRQSKGYRSTADESVALNDVEPPFRDRSRPLDWNGFNHARMVSVLRGFLAEEIMPPIDLLILPTLDDWSRQPFKYRVIDGVHRFYASMAVGFELLPVTRRGVSS